MATFPLLIVYPDCQIFFKINRVQAVDDVNKLCKFDEILTINVDCIA